MYAFTSYAWPGNVRELQNLVERAVIRSNDGVLSNPLPSFARDGFIVAPARESSKEGRREPFPISTPSPAAASNGQGTLKDSERSLILRTLEATGWINGGADGAAARLGLKRTTLIAKMKKLGISRPLNGLSENWESKPIWESAKE
jgi:transcriptional regulator with GAF, ATPase, and Fis domain